MYRLLYIMKDVGNREGIDIVKCLMKEDLGIEIDDKSVNSRNSDADALD